jgi:hypothetical protein
LSSLLRAFCPAKSLHSHAGHIAGAGDGVRRSCSTCTVHATASVLHASAADTANHKDTQQIALRPSLIRPVLIDTAPGSSHSVQARQSELLLDQELFKRLSNSFRELGDRACVICFDGVADHVMVPCGHGGYCGSCAERVCAGHVTPYNKKVGQICPVCRTPVEAVVKISLDTRKGQSSPAVCAQVVQSGTRI